MKLLLVFTLGISVSLYAISVRSMKESDQPIHRDLSHYAKAGPFDFRLSLYTEDPARIEQMMAQFREFLWQRWKCKQFGYVEATFYSVEGEPHTSAFFVERNSRGVWQIVVEAKHYTSDRFVSGIKQLKETTRSVYTMMDKIDRIEPPLVNSAPMEHIPEKAMRAPDTYQLRLRNKTTNESLIL